MAWKGKTPLSRRRVIGSFTYAIQGLCYALKTERNFQIHLIAAVIVSVWGFAFQLNKVEWLFVLICIFGMFSLELLNSAIERAVDLATEEIRPLAKQAKDLAAGAVLVFAIMTVVIGVIIFLPKVLDLFR